VDPREKVMVTTTRNLNHTRAMSVIECQTFRAHPENSNWYGTPCPRLVGSSTARGADLLVAVSPALVIPTDRTQVVTEARIVSNVGWGLKSRVEQFGLTRFQSSTEKSRQALRYTINALKQLAV